MIQYPEGLPYPERTGYGFTPTSPIRRTISQSGRARIRRNKSSVPTVASVSWSMSNAQAQLFESWWEEVLISGTAWFECPMSSRMGDKLYRARFVDIYNGPLEHGHEHWRFTAMLELYERPILRGGWALYAPDYMRYMSEFDVAMNRTWPEASEA